MCEQVNKKLDEDGESANLAEYLYIDAVTAVYPRAEYRDNVAAGIVKLTLTRELTDNELEEVKNTLSGQFSDGWGEGFEENEFKAGDYTVYIFFTI